MTKRYVYWRTEHGTAERTQSIGPITSDESNAPRAILAQIGMAASVNADTVSWNSFDVPWNELVVRNSAIVYDQNGVELNQTSSSGLLRDAVRNVIKKQGGGKPILPNDVITAADRLAAEFFQKPFVDYRLLTTLSVESLPAKVLKISDREIFAAGKQRNRYVLPKALIEGVSSARPFRRHIDETRYLKIVIRTKGRDIHEGSATALDAINLLRGLWTLYGQYGLWRLRIGRTKRDPIGIIHLGPVHTLHKLDGSPADEIYWFDPEYTSDQDVFTKVDKWKEMEKFRRSALRQIERLEYKTELRRLISRYVSALDELDLDTAFLRLWSILENVTGTIGGRYEETIRRAVFIYADRPPQKELLACLRVYRNQMVHAAKTSNDKDMIAYVAKNFVEPHLLRLIRNDYSVTSIKEYAEFLGLPTNVDTLRKRIASYRRALKMHEQPP